MYKILVIDAEKYTGAEISTFLMSNNIGFELYEINDYRKAQEYITNYEIDIVVANLCAMGNDLKRIQELRQINKYLKVIIIHNEESYECAICALRSGISDYWIKPLEETVMHNAFKRVMDEIDDMRHRVQADSRRREYVIEHMLNLAVNGSSFQEIEQYCEKTIDLSFINEYRCMMMIDFNKNFFDEKGNNFKTKIVEKLPGKVSYLNLNHAQGLLFFANIDDNYLNIARYVIKKVQNEYAEECFIAVSSEFEGYEGIAIAMEELDSMMENKFYHKASEIFSKEKKGTQSMVASIDDDSIMKQMRQDIRVRDINGLRMHFGEFAQKYSNKTNFSQLYIKFLFASLLKEFTCNISNVDEQVLNAEIDELYRASDFEMVVSVINRNIDKLAEDFNKIPQAGHREIEIVKQYIQEHYGEEISVDKLGEKVFMAPSYLSYIFKKETGQNLSKYIKSYRMDKAKDMLENTSRKIVDISSICGYPNVSYFCSSFREYFGISPQKYREAGDENAINGVC